MLLSEVTSKEYFEGKRESLWDFAWWKCGTQYVGSGIKTLKEALEEINKEEKEWELFNSKNSK